MGKGLKIKIKLRNLVVAKPENHYLRLKTAINIKFLFGKKKQHSFLGDIKLHIDQIKKNRGKVQ